jgi:hypothetical protein
MVRSVALPTLLSQALVAFTIEFDNEFEHRMPHTTTRGPAAHSGRGPWLTSMAMWSNFMRFIEPDGVALRDVADLAGIVNLPGLQRWHYVTIKPSKTVEPGEAVEPSRAARRPSRDASGIVRPTRAGRHAQSVWEPLAGVIEDRWSHRFGPESLAELRTVLIDFVGHFDRDLPRYLPVSGVGRHDLTGLPSGRTGGDLATLDLAALLSQVLLVFTMDFERESRLSLALGANVLRVLDDAGVRVRDLPLLTGVSAEAVSVSLGFLGRIDCVVVEPDPAASRVKRARLTPTGQAAQAKHRRLLAQTEDGWATRYGDADVDRLRSALTAVLTQEDGDQPKLAEGLRPYADGWRAHPPYAHLTEAMLADPLAALPHYPMVSHRGGFPDGS